MFLADLLYATPYLHRSYQAMYSQTFAHLLGPNSRCDQPLDERYDSSYLPNVPQSYFVACTNVTMWTTRYPFPICAPLR